MTLRSPDAIVAAAPPRKLRAVLRSGDRRARGPDLLALAELERRERVLDVACGTGIVARMADAVPKADDASRAELEREVVSHWQPLERDGGMRLMQPMLAARARR